MVPLITDRVGLPADLYLIAGGEVLRGLSQEHVHCRLQGDVGRAAEVALHIDRLTDFVARARGIVSAEPLGASLPDGNVEAACGPDRTRGRGPMLGKLA